MSRRLDEQAEFDLAQMELGRIPQGTRVFTEPEFIEEMYGFVVDWPGAAHYGSSCLEAFIHLRTQKQVDAFERKYYRLGMCGHTDPTLDGLTWHQAASCPRCAAGEPANPLAAYLWCARNLRAALLLGAALRQNKSAADDVYEDLDFAFMGLTNLQGIGAASPLPEQWRALQLVVRRWTRAGIKLTIFPAQYKAVEGLEPIGIKAQNIALDLRGVLGLQLAGALESRRGVYTCPCGEPFTPARAPWNNGKRPGYCPACQSREAKNERERGRWQSKHPEAQRARKPT